MLKSNILKVGRKLKKAKKLSPSWVGWLGWAGLASAGWAWLARQSGLG